MRKVVIGPAILYRADCRDVLPTLGKVDAVVTDPPYGIGFRSNYRRQKYEAMAADDEEWPLEFAAGIRAKHSAYVFCRWNDIRRVHQPRSVITWVKNNWGMGDLEHAHARQTEVVLFYPGPRHRFPRSRPRDVIHAPRTGNKLHPTEKPVQLMKSICEWTRGDVLDPFMGSGTTGVAAIQLGRKFIGIEKDAKYFDIAVKRIREAVKQSARPEEAGQHGTVGRRHLQAVPA